MMGRSIALIAFLVYASIQDLKRRELGMLAWAPIVLIGLSSLSWELIVHPTSILPTRLILVSTVIMMPSLLGLYGFGDAFILFGLSLAHITAERPIVGGCFLLLPSPEFGPTLLLNAELLSSSTLISNLIQNLRLKVWKELTMREAPFREKVINMLLLRAMSPREPRSDEFVRGYEGMTLVKQTIPMVLFILLGYFQTLLFGSLIPLHG